MRTIIAFNPAASGFPKAIGSLDYIQGSLNILPAAKVALELLPEFSRW